MKHFSIVFLFMFSFIFLSAQNDEIYFSRQSEIGLNVTNLLQNFIPIRDAQKINSLKIFSFKIKMTDRKCRLRSSIGFRLNDARLLEDANFFHIALGLEKLNSINNKWKYFYGGEFIATFIDDFSSQTLSTPFNEGQGVSLIVGLMYSLNEKISISTESSLTAIFISDIGLELVPPFSIQLNFYWVKNRIKIKAKNKFIF